MCRTFRKPEPYGPSWWPTLLGRSGSGEFRGVTGHLNSCDPFFRSCGQCLVLMHGRTGEDRAVEEHPGSAPVRDFPRWFT